MIIYSSILTAIQRSLSTAVQQPDDGKIEIPPVLLNSVGLYEPITSLTGSQIVTSTSVNSGISSTNEIFFLSPGIWRIDGVVSLPADPGGLTQFRQRLSVSSGILVNVIATSPSSFSWSIPYLLLRETTTYTREPIGVPVVPAFASTTFSRLI